MTQFKAHTSKILLLSSLLLFSACSEEKQVAVKKVMPPVSVKTITVNKEPIAIWKQYTGMTKAKSDQEVRARVSGILEEIYFKDGQSVTKGQKLFKIQQEEYIAALNAAKAQKRRNQASLRLARADVARYKPLVEEGLAPRATLEQYQAQESGLQASIFGDNAKIKQAELSLSYTVIYAPISGTISARKVDIGNLVRQEEATVLTTIMSINPIYAYFSPSQSDVAMFQKYRNKDKPDAYIEVQGAMDTLRLDGHVDFANNVVDSLTSTITMRATISNPDGKVLPGTFVYVNLFINDKYSFRMIPPEVIQTDQLGKYIFIVGEGNKAKRVDIQTDYASKYYVSVNDGLQDGDRVIVSALVKMRSGRSITPTDATATDGIQAILKANNLIPKKN